MKILSRNTVVLKNSLNFNEDNTVITFQANTELYVEGCTYADLFTPKTVFDLTCPVANISNINTVAAEQVQAWVNQQYPEI